MTFKRAIKRATGRAAIAASSFAKHEKAAAILYYHRVADIGFIDRRIDDHNVSPATFESQIAALSEMADIVALTDLPRLVRLRPRTSKPLVSLTFDDGYENFVTNCMPVLKKYAAPATLSVVSSIIDDTLPMSFDRWASKNRHRTDALAWTPITSSGIESCLDSGLVTLGAHSNEHRNARSCSRAAIRDEVERSAEILRGRFGKENVPVYAYPYGNTHLGHVPAEYETAVRDAGFEMAVTTDHGQITADTDLFRLPRIEAHGLDSGAALMAKIEGKISPYYLLDYARSAAYKLGNTFKPGRQEYSEN